MRASNAGVSVAVRSLRRIYYTELQSTLECRLVHTADLGLHTLFVGEVVDVKIDEEVLTPECDADIRKINPVLFDPGARGYYGVGEFLGNAFSEGRGIPGGSGGQ